MLWLKTIEPEQWISSALDMKKSESSIQKLFTAPLRDSAKMTIVAEKLYMTAICKLFLVFKTSIKEKPLLFICVIFLLLWLPHKPFLPLCVNATKQEKELIAMLECLILLFGGRPYCINVGNLTDIVRRLTILNTQQ